MHEGISQHDQRIEQWYRPENFEPLNERETSLTLRVMQFPLLEIGFGRRLLAAGTNIERTQDM